MFAEDPISTGHTSLVKTLHPHHRTSNPTATPMDTPNLEECGVCWGTTWLDHHVIRPSNSPWSSPVIMVKKKDGSWRFYTDYHKLNAVTCYNAYSLPRIDATLDFLAGATNFTTSLDIGKWLWRSRIRRQLLSLLQKVISNLTWCHLALQDHHSRVNRLYSISCYIWTITSTTCVPNDWAPVKAERSYTFHTSVCERLM